MTGHRIPDAPVGRAKWPFVLALLLAAAFALAFLCVWGPYFLLVSGPRDRAAKLETKVRAEGYPLNAEELNAWYPAVPDDENIALICAEAIEHFLPVGSGPSSEAGKAREPGTQAVLDLWYPEEGETDLDAEALRITREWLVLYEEGFRIIGRARDLESSHYDIDFSKGLLPKTPHLPRLRILSRLVRVRAVMFARVGNADAAFDSLLDLRPIFRSLEEEPELLSQAVRVALISRAVDAVREQLELVQFSDAQLAALASEFADIEVSGPVYRGLAGDRASGLISLKRGDSRYNGQPLGAKKAVPKNVATAGRVLWWASIHTQIRQYLEAMTGLVDLEGLPYDDQVAGAKEIKEKVRNSAIVPNFVDWIVPQFSMSIKVNRRVESLLRDLTAVIGVERFRLETGALPKSLEELVPVYLAVVPLDPKTAEPVTYRVLNPGYVVFTNGHDGSHFDAWVSKGMPADDLSDDRVHVAR